MSALIIILVLAYAIKTAFIDGSYAVRGQMPPRLRARMAAAARAGAAGDHRRVRYGFGDYFSDLWDYAFTALRARQQRRIANPRYGARRYLADRWMHAWEDAVTKHNAARDERLANPHLPRDPGRLGRLAARVRGWTRRGKDQHPQIEDSIIEPDDTPPPAAAPPAGPAGPARPGQVCPPIRGTPSRGGRRLAPVIPIHSKEEAMSDNTAATGEVTGLATAQQYAAGMAGAFADQAAHTEQFMANLTANQVSGDAVTAAAQAQELSNAAAQAWATAQEALHRHGQVAEAYAANPDAGSREFVTSE